MEFKANQPIYLQVIDDIRRKLVTGAISPGQKLTSVRELAMNYQINPNTAARVYKEMELMGMCYTKRGLGTFITDDSKVIDGIRKDMAAEYLDTFVNGMHSLGYDIDEVISLITGRYEKASEQEVSYAEE